MADRRPLQRATGGEEPTALLAGRRILDMDRYVPAYFAIINNRLSRGASRLYLRRFGIGVTEWRLVAMLALEPDIPAARACEYLGMDKALVSRALRRLDGLGHLKAGSNGRRRTWRLSERGEALYDEILDVALQREARLLAGVSPAQKEAFLAVARQMMANLPLVEDGDAAG